MEKCPKIQDSIKNKQSYNIKSDIFFSGRKTMKFLKKLKKQKFDFSIFKGISIIFEKSCFRKFSIFSKFSKFRKIFKNFRDSTLTNFNFRSTQRIFLIFFYGSKWIFKADQTSLSEMSSESTGRNDFTFLNCLTPNSRFYIKYYPVS